MMFEVVVLFTVGGPAVSGQWSSAETAVRKFRSFIGLYGDTTATITLTSSGLERMRLARTWTREHGAQVLCSGDGLVNPRNPLARDCRQVVC
ncbi:hypothetical protein [Streptomyces sp. NPDC056549]|uniref:hypothetical protein n=1 Tax=Streptomyces sp. NPDC056549 TaxID=3345864 RepID=UPI003677220B